MQNKSLRRKKTEPSKQNPELNIFKLTDYLAILFLEVYPEILLGLIYIKMSKKKKGTFLHITFCVSQEGKYLQGISTYAFRKAKT